jgi:hypothetical protein
MALKAALTAAVNAQLASGQPITAAMHRAAELLIINELYDANSRGAVLAGIDVAVSLTAGDQVLLIRSGAAKLADKDLLGGNVNGGTP